MALILLGAPGLAKAAPDDWSRLVLQLADAAGTLSSRSCRDGVAADRASRGVSAALRKVQGLKYLDFATARKFRSRKIVPTIRAQRRINHSARDCEASRKSVEALLEEWDLNVPVRTASSGPTDGGDRALFGLATRPMLGASRTDTLSANGATGGAGKPKGK